MEQRPPENFPRQAPWARSNANVQYNQRPPIQLPLQHQMSMNDQGAHQPYQGQTPQFNPQSTVPPSEGYSSPRASHPPMLQQQYYAPPTPDYDQESQGYWQVPEQHYPPPGQQQSPSGQQYVSPAQQYGQLVQQHTPTIADSASTHSDGTETYIENPINHPGHDHRAREEQEITPPPPSYVSTGKSNLSIPKPNLSSLKPYTSFPSPLRKPKPQSWDNTQRPSEQNLAEGHDHRFAKRPGLTPLSPVHGSSHVPVMLAADYHRDMDRHRSQSGSIQKGNQTSERSGSRSHYGHWNAQGGFCETKPCILM